MVLPAPTFDPRKTLAAVHAERCTALYGDPTMFIAELALPDFDRFDLTSLRTGIMAGSSCPSEQMTRVMRDMCMKEVTICYGMTETSPVSWQSSVDTPVEQRVHTVGRVHPHVECKVVAVDDDGDGGEAVGEGRAPRDVEAEIASASAPRTVRVGERGELWTKGYVSCMSMRA